jgi:hypothetical protein
MELTAVVKPLARARPAVGANEDARHAGRCVAVGRDDAFLHLGTASVERRRPRAWTPEPLVSVPNRQQTAKPAPATVVQ